MDVHALETTHISKAFGKHQAVADVALELPVGSVLGIIGPNGAGKTTILRMLAGVMAPDDGTVKIFGKALGKARCAGQKRIGYLPEQTGFYEYITAEEFLTLNAKLFGLKGNAVAEGCAKVAETCGLGEFMNQTIESLSKGMRRRVFLAAALVHDPDILILDEPTDGLDPRQKQQIYALLAQLKETKAIIISTHNLDEAETLCDQLALLHQGNVKALKPVSELISTYGSLASAFQALTTPKAEEESHA